MSPDKSICKKFTLSLEPDNASYNPEVMPAKYDPARHMAPRVAHELNSVLTIVQGYAERLLLQNNTDPALTPQLRLISEASKHAAVIVRRATPPDANNFFSQTHCAQPSRAVV